MKLIIGLGNPGRQYANTRHNVGFMCADFLQKKLELPEFKLQKKFFAEISEGIFNNEKIIIAKPQTYMNVSGKSVKALLDFYHCEQDDLWVIFDDVDLPLGKIRVKPDGSAGSHNGMKSIVEALGFQNFPRIRIGIESRGQSSPSAQEISSFVLNKFNKQEMSTAQKATEEASNALILALKNGISETQQRYN